MPYLNLPDATSIEVPEGMDYATAIALAKKQFPDAFPIDTSEAKEGAIPSFVQGTRFYGQGIKQLLGGQSGEELRDEEKKARRSEAERVKQASWEDVKKAWNEEQGVAPAVGKYWDLAKETIAGSLPAMGGIMLGSRVGALAGAPFGPVGIGAGSLLGGFLGAIPAQSQQMVQQQVEAHPDAPVNVGAALLGTSEAGALDVVEMVGLFGTRLGLGKGVTQALKTLLGQGKKGAAEVVLLKSAEKSLAKEAAVANRGWGKSAAIGAGRGTLFEVPIEVAQQVIQRAQADQDLLSPDAWKEYEGIAASMVAPGVLFGGVGGAHAKVSAQQAVEKRAADTRAVEAGKALAEKQVAEQKAAEEIARTEALPVGAGPQKRLLEGEASTLPLQQTSEELTAQLNEAVKSGDVTKQNELRGALNRVRVQQAQKDQEQQQLEEEKVALPRQHALLKAQEEKARLAAEESANQDQGVEAVGVAGVAYARFKGAREAAEVRAAELGVKLTPLTEQIKQTEVQLKKLKTQAYTYARNGEPEKAASLIEKEKILQARIAALNLAMPDTEQQPDIFAEQQRLDEGAQARQEAEKQYQQEQKTARMAEQERQVATDERLLKTLGGATLTPKDKLIAAQEQLAKESEAKAAEERTINPPQAEAIAAELEKFKPESTSVRETLGVSPELPKNKLIGIAREAKKAHEAALGDFTDVVERIRQGVFFGRKGEGPVNPAAATSTLAGLTKQGEEHAAKIQESLLKEVAAQRLLQNKPELTPAEAREAQQAIAGTLKEILAKTREAPANIAEDALQIKLLQQDFEKAKKATRGISAADAQERYVRAMNVVEATRKKHVPGTPVAPAMQEAYLEKLREQMHAAKRVEELAAAIADRQESLRQRTQGERTAGQVNPGEIERGVDPSEVRGWRKTLNSVRGNLMRAEKTRTVVPADRLLPSTEKGAAFEQEQARAASEEPKFKGVTTRAGERKITAIPGYTQGRGLVVANLDKALAIPGLQSETKHVLQQARDVLGENRGSRQLVAIAAQQADRALLGQQLQLVPLQAALRQEQTVRQDTAGVQRELFTPAQLKPTSAVAPTTLKAAEQTDKATKVPLAQRLSVQDMNALKRTAAAMKKLLASPLVQQMKDAEGLPVAKQLQERLQKHPLFKQAQLLSESPNPELEEFDPALHREILSLVDKAREAEQGRQEAEFSQRKYAERNAEGITTEAVRIAVAETRTKEERQQQQSLNERLGLPAVQRTSEPVVVRNRKTAEDKYLVTKVTNDYDAQIAGAKKALKAAESRGAPEHKLARIKNRLEILQEKAIRPARFVETKKLEQEPTKERTERQRRETLATAEAESAPRFYKKLSDALEKTKLQLQAALAQPNLRKKAKILGAKIKELLPPTPKFNAEWGQYEFADYDAKVLAQLQKLSVEKAAVVKQLHEKLQQTTEKLAPKELVDRAKRIQQEMDKMRKRWGDEVAWQPSRPPREKSRQAATEAIETLHRNISGSGLRRHAAPAFRTGAVGNIAEAKQAQKELAAEQREEKRAARIADFDEPSAASLDELEQLGVHLEADGTAFHLREEGQHGVDPAAAQALADRVIAQVQGNIRAGIEYVATADEAHQDFKDAAARKGRTLQEVSGMILPNGRALVIGENHKTVDDVERTFMHELVGHYGPDAILGKKGFQALKDKIWQGDITGVRELADALNLSHVVNGILEGEKALGHTGPLSESAKLAVTRELVADTATYNLPISTTDKKAATLVQQFRKWISAAVRWGMQKLGLESHAAMTSQEIFNLVRQSMTAFRAQNVGPYQSPTAQGAFRGLTAEEAFGRANRGADTLVAGDEGKHYWSERGTYMLRAVTAIFDRYAGAVEALKRGGLTSKDYRAVQALSDTRAYDDRSIHTTDVVALGPKRMTVDKVKGHEEHHWMGAQRTAKGLPHIIEPLKDLAALTGQSVDTVGKLATYFGLVKRGKRVGYITLASEMAGDPAKHAEFIQEVKDHEAWLAAHPKEHALLNAYFERYQKFNHGLVDMLVEGGVITSEIGAKWKSFNDYIPAYRLLKDGTVEFLKPEGWTHFSDITRHPEMKQLLGGSEKIMPFYASSIRNVNIIISQVLENQAAKSNVFAFQAAGLLQKEGPKDPGIRDGKGGKGDDVIHFRIKGEDKWARVNTDATGVPTELAMKGMRGISMQNPFFLQLMQGPASLVRKMVTRNPMFGIRQLYSDLPSLLITSGSKMDIAKALKDVGQGAAGFVTGKISTNPTVGLLQAGGLLSSDVYAGTHADLEKVSKALAGGEINSWSQLMAELDKRAMAANAVSRAHIYDQMKAQGLSDMEAAIATRQAVDFTRYGSSPGLRMLATIVPFMNTQLQSLYSLAKAMRGTQDYNEVLKIRQKFFTRGLMLTAASLSYATLMEDDEAYKNATPAQRYYYWFIPIKGFDEPLRIRVPFEVGVLFKSVPEALYRVLTTKEEKRETGGEAFMGVMSALSNSQPFSTPSPVKLLIEQWTGTSMFTHQPLENSHLQTLEPFMRYKTNTTETAKAIGKAFNVSPIRLENAINTIGTGTAMALFSMFDPLVRAMSNEVAGEIERMPSKAPFFGSAFQPVDAGGIINSAYEMTKDAKLAATTLEALRKAGKPKAYKEYVEEHRAEIGLGKTLAGSFSVKMNNLKQIERQIQEAPEHRISPKEKADRLKLIRAEQTRLATRVREAYLRAGT